MSVLIISLSSLSWRGNIFFTEIFKVFLSLCSVWTKFCQNFRIEEQFQNQSGYNGVLFWVHLFEALKKSRKVQEIQPIWELVIAMGFETWSFSPWNTKTKDLKGIKQSTKTGKEWKNVSHLSCRMVGVRALEVLNWFYFFGKNGL